MSHEILVPIHDRVLVKRLAEPEKTAGGLLYIPDTAKEKPARGIVVSVGAGKSDDAGRVTPLAVKPDDVVLFGKYAGTEVKLGGEEHMILREEEILGVLRTT